MPAMRPRARFLEFFAATIRNKNTRMADYRPVYQLFAWCDRHRIGGIAGIEPSHVAAYIENLQHAMSKPTAAPGGDPHAVRLAGHRPGCRSQSCAHTVRGPKHVVKGGKTTVLTAEQACERLDSIDITPLAAHTPAKQKVIINEMPLGVASDWDTFAQACNVTFMCSHANVSAERLRSHVRFFAAYLEGAKVAQCAVAFRRFGRTRHIGRFVDGVQLLPEYAALWGQIMQGMLRILGPGRYYYGTEWSIEEDRTNDLTALHGITIQTVFPYVIHGVDFSRWPSWEAYRQAISNNARRNAAKALKSDPKVEILIDYGSRTILDTIPFMRMRSRMRHRKGLDFNVLEQAMRYVTRMLLMRKHGYTARVVHLGKVVSYFCGIDFGRHTFYTYGASAPEKNGASWLLILDMLQRSWKPDGKFLMGQAETGAGRDNLFLFRQHCRVSDFPSAIVRFTYEP